MNKRWKVDSGETNFGKDPSEIHKKGCLSYNRNDYCKAQQRNICENYFFVVVLECSSATLYNLIAMWPLGLALMLTS